MSNHLVYHVNEQLTFRWEKKHILSHPAFLLLSLSEASYGFKISSESESQELDSVGQGSVKRLEKFKFRFKLNKKTIVVLLQATGQVLQECQSACGPSCKAVSLSSGQMCHHFSCCTVISSEMDT